MHPGMVIIASRGDLEMTIDASRDDDRGIPGWLSCSSRDGFLGLRLQHPWMAIDASRMAIDASVDGDLYTTRWRRSILGWRSMPPGMDIIATRDGER